MIIDGKEMARKEYEKLKEEIASLNKKPNLTAVLVGNNPSSLRYIAQKKKWAHEIGIDFQLIQFEETVKQEEIIAMLTKLNNDERVNGIIVQLPLPAYIESDTIISTIFPIKDIDGFTAVNMGKVVLGDESCLAPCTPSGVIHICKSIGVDLEGKNVTIIGRSNIVGKPLINICINAGATVTCCNSKTKNLGNHTKNADIIILATGKPGLLTKEMIQKEAVIIDVGFTVIDGKIYGDACFQEILENGNPITPVPGGVGALTVVYLMKNTLKAFYLQNKVVGTI